MVVSFFDRVQLLALQAAGGKRRYETTAFGKMHLVDLPGTPGGPTLVIFHGLGDAGVRFARTALRLRKHFGRILIPDLLGHGWSDDHPELSAELIFGALVEGVARSLKKSPAVVVGNSLGGAMALAFAEMRPDLVSRLVLISPAGAPYNEEEYEAVIDNFRLDARAKAIDFVHRLHARPQWYSRLIAGDVARNFARASMRHLLGSFRNSPPQSPEMLALIKAPTLLLWGRLDAILPKSSVAFFRAHLPGAVEEPEDWGHCPHFDGPFRLAERLRRFTFEEGG
jgi:pimeloyl-ACP methyl ester carboxylesterase